MVKKDKKSTPKTPLGGTTKHKFKTYTFRNIPLDNLLKFSQDEFSRLVASKARRHLLRGLGKKSMKFLARLRKAKKQLVLEINQQLLKHI